MTPSLRFRIAMPAVAVAGVLFAASSGEARLPPSSLADTPIAVTAISAEQLERNGVMERNVVDELNRLRSDPAGYLTPREQSQGGDLPSFLRGAGPAPALTIDPRLTEAALSQVNYLGPNGLLTHAGPGGSTPGQRIKIRGLTSTMTAEELVFGKSDSHAAILQLLQDTGVIGAPHRRDLLNPVFTNVGVGCGPHRGQRFVCVIDFSTSPLGVTPPTTTAVQEPTPGPPTPRAVRMTPVPRGGVPGLPQQSVTFVHPPAQPATPSSAALPSGNTYLPNVTPGAADVANLPPIGYTPSATIPAGAQGPEVAPPSTPSTFDPAPAPYTPSDEQAEDESKPPL